MTRKPIPSWLPTPWSAQMWGDSARRRSWPPARTEACAPSLGPSRPPAPSGNAAPQARVDRAGPLHNPEFAGAVYEHIAMGSERPGHDKRR